MYKTVLQQIAGIEIWPIIAMLIFMVVFAVIAIRAVRMDRDTINKYAAIPLDSAETDTLFNGRENNERE